MLKVFGKLEENELHVMNSVYILLALLQIVTCSWTFSQILVDEKELIFLVGYKMYQVTPDMSQALELFVESNEGSSHVTLLDRLSILKFAVSFALVGASVHLVYSSMSHFFSKPSHKIASWMQLVPIVSYFGAVGAFTWTGIRTASYVSTFATVTGINGLLLLQFLIMKLTRNYLEKRRRPSMTDKGIQMDLYRDSLRRGGSEASMASFARAKDNSAKFYVEKPSCVMKKPPRQSKQIIHIEPSASTSSPNPANVPLKSERIDKNEQDDISDDLPPPPPDPRPETESSSRVQTA